MSAAPKQTLAGDSQPPWYRPAVALTHIIPPGRRALAAAHRWLTQGIWGDATPAEKEAALALIEEARR
jgi:hypothetical protein